MRPEDPRPVLVSQKKLQVGLYNFKPSVRPVILMDFDTEATGFVRFVHTRMYIISII